MLFQFKATPTIPNLSKHLLLFSSLSIPGLLIFVFFVVLHNLLRHVLLFSSLMFFLVLLVLLLVLACVQLPVWATPAIPDLLRHPLLFSSLNIPAGLLIFGL